MSSFWTDLLFLHGYINDLELAHRLMNAPPPPPAKPEPSRKRPSYSPRAMFSTWSARLCQGIGDGVVHTQ
jgi:hypothetical protein